MKRSEYLKMIPKATNANVVFLDKADTNDIVSLIELADSYEAKEQPMLHLSQHLKAETVKETVYNVWKFIRKEVKYIADERTERAKASFQTLSDGFGDCKSMSILAVSILRSLGYACTYRYTAYAKGDVTHVYVLVFDGSENIVCDAVNKVFNHEPDFFKNIDKPMSTTQAAYVRGLKGVGSLVDKADNSAVLSQPTKFNTDLMTEGELRMYLLREQMRVAMAAHPDSTNAQEWLKSIQLIDNVIYKGVHGLRGNAYTRESGKFIDFTKKIIKQSQKNTAPSGGDIFVLANRASIAGGQDPLIPLEDAEKICQKWKVGGFYEPSKGWIQNPNLNEYDSCMIKVTGVNNWKNILNENLEKSAHHWLYEFAGSPDKAIKDKLATRVKMVDHQKIIPEIQRLTYFSQTNLREWQRLGVMRNSANRNLGALQPEQVIDNLKYHNNLGFYDENGRQVTGNLADRKDRIGILGIDDAIIICIIIAISAKAIGGLIQISQGKEPTAFKDMEKILKDATYPAQGLDWRQEDTDTGGSDCPTGFYRNTAGLCVPIDTTDGGTDNTTNGNTEGGGNTKLLIVGAALVGAALMFSK